MTPPVVTVVRTGVANLASVRAAFERLGCEVRATTDPAEVREAARLVLPGVGAFARGRAALDELGLVSALTERVDGGRATLAICLGQQLLADGSQEAPGVRGLGLVPGSLERFPADVRVPQLGWNRVRGLLDGEAYFANSFRLRHSPAGWDIAWADYGGPFVAAFERGAVLACQFHPELSGAFGRSILERWLQRGGAPC